MDGHSPSTSPDAAPAAIPAMPAPSAQDQNSAQPLESLPLLVADTTDTAPPELTEQADSMSTTISTPVLPAPTVVHTHAQLPIGRARSLSAATAGRKRSDSTLSTSSLAKSPPLPTPTATPTPSTASANLLAPTPSLSHASSGQSSTYSRTLGNQLPPSAPAHSSTHISSILPPASFFRPSRPSQGYGGMSASRSIPHGSAAQRGSLMPLSASRPVSGPRINAGPVGAAAVVGAVPPRRSAAVPDTAIPLTAFAAKRASLASSTGKRISHGSMGSDLGDESGFGTVNSSDLGHGPVPPKPTASREPLISPRGVRIRERSDEEAGVRTPQGTPGVRGSIERIFRRSFSGESLRNSVRSPKSPYTPRTGDVLVPEGKGDAATPRPPSRHPHFAPLPPRTRGPLAVVKPPWLVQMHSSKSGKPLKNYQLHPSQNRFFCGGRLLTGGDRPYAFAASIIVVGTIAGFWFSTTCVWWWHNVSPAVAAVGAYMCLLTISNMAATAFRDPGIVPRGLDPDPPYQNISPAEDAPAAPLPREIRVREQVVRVKYCVTCKTYRPPRSSHCKPCDNCVDGCDHHCQWVNNCIGRRNYTSFITFLVLASLTLVLVIVTSALHLWMLTRRDGISFREALREAFGSAVACALGLVVIWPLLALMGYHVRLLFLNVTTIEQVRNQAYKPGPMPPNPFTYGRWYYNLGYMLCRPVGATWIASEEAAVEDQRVRCEEDWEAEG